MGAAFKNDQNLLKHRLFLKLSPVAVGELYLATKLEKPAFIFNGEQFEEVIAAGQTPTREQILQLLKNQIKLVFLFHEDLDQIKNSLQQALIKTTRSLSIGDPVENGKKQIKLLLLNLATLYKNPYNDALLMTHFQSAQNLSKFLLENKKHQATIFQATAQETMHFTILQPILSSLLLLGFLQNTHLFHEREIESLFLTSYLKDVGIGLIPENKYDVKNLTIDEKEIFAQHADYSFDLLENRVPLSKTNLTIIKHHHFMNDRLKRVLNKEKWEPTDHIVHGMESTLVGLSDIIIAMTTDRPYRTPMSLYHSLEIIRKMIGDDYPQEFKSLVIFLRQFFKQ